MKKLISILILAGMLTATLAGCTTASKNPVIPPTYMDPGAQPGVSPSGPPSVTPPENESDTKPVGQPDSPALNVDPATAIRLLLASERLNAALLKNEGDIFEQGAETMLYLAAEAEKGLTNRPLPEIRPLSTHTVPPSYQLLSDPHTVYDGGDNGGLVTFDGENYMFSDFVEVSNSYSYFEGNARYISTMAKDAADLIDSIKKNVRVVDKWVRMDDWTRYYLHVGENEEVLYSHIHDRETVCRRYRDEEGRNVYEYYSQSETFYERLVYIPGAHFEVIRGFFGEEGHEDYLIADNTKGYWEFYVVGPFPTHYNISYMVMKEDICYDSFYDPKTGSINFIKTISADKKTDILYYQGGENDPWHSFIDLHFSGFDGIAGVRAEADIVSMEDMGGDLGSVPTITDMERAVLVLENGKEIHIGDTFLDGKVEVYAIRTSVYYPHYTGELGIRVSGETVAEKLANVKGFIGEVGLECRRDLNSVLPGVQRAFDELSEITQYHTWNGFAQATEDGIAAAIEAEKADTAKMADMIAAVRNAEEINFADKEIVELNAHFAPATVTASEGIAQSDMTVQIQSLTLSVSDTLLFVENQPYTLGFALKGESGLIHVETSMEAQTTAYTPGESFTVSAGNVTLTLPALTDGVYTLVAYIATDDGIRSSAHVALPFNTVEEGKEITLKRSTMKVSLLTDGTIGLTYELITDLYTTMAPEESLSYQGLYEMMACFVCEYGIPSDSLIERLTDAEANTYTALTGEEEIIPSGSYRLAYNIENGEKIVNGYLHVEFTAAEVPEEETGPEGETQPENESVTEGEPAPAPDPGA